MRTQLCTRKSSQKSAPGRQVECLDECLHNLCKKHIHCLLDGLLLHSSKLATSTITSKIRGAGSSTMCSTIRHRHETLRVASFEAPLCGTVSQRDVPSRRDAGATRRSLSKSEALAHGQTSMIRSEMPFWERIWTASTIFQNLCTLTST